MITLSKLKRTFSFLVFKSFSNSQLIQFIACWYHCINIIPWFVYLKILIFICSLSFTFITVPSTYHSLVFMMNDYDKDFNQKYIQAKVFFFLFQVLKKNRCFKTINALKHDICDLELLPFVTSWDGVWLVYYHYLLL